jgi:hypothetical protein
MATTPFINTRIIVLCFELLYRHLYHMTHASACSEGGNSVLPLSERKPFLSLHSAPQLHLVSDALTGALCAAVCEVLAVTHYQRQSMME